MCLNFLSVSIFSNNIESVFQITYFPTTSKVYFRLALSPAILTKRTHNVIIFLSKLEDTISLLRYYTKRCYDIILSLSLSTTKYSHLRNNISYLLNIHNSYMLPLYTKQYSSSENCKRDFICLCVRNEMNNIYWSKCNIHMICLPLKIFLFFFIFNMD
jgi:hypothetical protein